jgi:hypothetical protein
MSCSHSCEIGSGDRGASPWHLAEGTELCPHPSHRWPTEAADGISKSRLDPGPLFSRRSGGALLAVVDGGTSLRLSLAALDEVLGAEERAELLVELGECRCF